MGALGACEPTGPATWLCWIQGIPLHQEMVLEQLDYEHKALQESLHVPKSHQHQHQRIAGILWPFGDSWNESKYPSCCYRAATASEVGMEEFQPCTWPRMQDSAPVPTLPVKQGHTQFCPPLGLKLVLGFFLLPALFHWGQSSEFSLEEETSEHYLSLSLRPS